MMYFSAFQYVHMAAIDALRTTAAVMLVALPHGGEKGALLLRAFGFVVDPVEHPRTGFRLRMEAEFHADASNVIPNISPANCSTCCMK